MESSKSSEIRETAARDYFRSGGKYNNPYPNGSDEFNHYERGWTQALKRDGGKQQEISNNRNYPYTKFRY